VDRLHNPFKQALKSGRLQIGLWHSLSSHLVVEVLADSGFDWILLDTEHAPNELPMVLAELQAMSGGTAHAVVRPAWNDPVIIKRLLDDGMIEESDDRPDFSLDDQRRRYYRLTKLGHAVAEAEAERMQRVLAMARAKRVLGPETA